MLGKPSSEVDQGKYKRRDADFGLAIMDDIAGTLIKLPKDVSDRFITLCLSLTGKKQATIISANAHTMTNPEDIKDKLYKDLHSLIVATPK